jgi:membrane associated rhomboid family serine protease
VVTGVLIVLNVAAFAFEIGLGSGVDAFVRRWGLVPADLHAGEPAAAVTLLTCTFLHAGWVHLIVNMVYLGVFGLPVERRLGHVAFGVLYLISALMGSLAYALIDPSAEMPAVGASGAIAGIIASHLVLFPNATLGSVAPVLFLRVVETTPTFLLLLLWLIAQFFSSVAALAGNTSNFGWAHAGGFASGLVLAPILRKWQHRSL